MYYENNRKNVYFWIVLLVIVVIVLNNPSVKRSPFIRGTKFIASNALYPFKYVIGGTFDNTIHGLSTFFRIKGIQKENEALNIEIKEYKTKLLLMNEIEKDNKRLRDILNFRSLYYASRLIPVEIIARTGNNWFEIIEINKGKDDNIVPDTAVINEQGLVGRILEVSNNSAKVLLITDPTSAVSVYDADTWDMGIASGNLMAPIRIKYMSANANIKVGDRIVTTGMSDTFPKGILVGKVKAVSKKDYDIFQKVEVASTVDFSKLDKLFVVAK